MKKRQVLLVSSVPLAAPWNGGDKNLARLLTVHDDDNIYIVQSDRFELWTETRITVVRDGNASPIPSPRQKMRAMSFLLRYTRHVDLVHIVASVRRPNPLVGPFLKLWKQVSRRPLVHTALSIGDGAVNTTHFPADITVVVTEYDQRRLTAAGVDNVVLVSPPLDFTDLKPSRSPADVTAELKLGDRAVLYAGHYGPYGGVSQCIESFARLPASLNDAVLVLACRTFPDQDPEVEAKRAHDLAANLGIGERMRVVGEVQDMPALISACVATVLVPLRLEGKMAIPLVLLESLALGRPIITGSEPPLQEALFDGGLSVKPGDIQALTSAMSRLLTDPVKREQLGNAGRITVRQRCAPEIAVKKYQQIYRRLSTDE